MQRLTLRDEVYLLAHDDRGEPRIHTGSLSFGLAGAILIDLVLSGHVTVEPGRVALRDTARTGDGIGDWAIAQMVGDQLPRQPRGWLGTIARDAYDRTTGGLHAAGLVTKTSYRRLLGSMVVRYPPAPDAPIGSTRARVWYAVNGRETPDDQCAALCGLVGTLRLESTLNVNLPSGELLSRLSYLLDQQQPAVREIVGTVSTMITEAAISPYR
ncbi:hypothetical protein F4553_006340 [Allocatelliglobosispora scoriae]|uniref:GPP34 family phosphoprotein n=1 Tax=Allocatelliglobosispora scoriae TaxID=643052 RepID=A0A841BZ92_9ACTN|nr:GPP34 family phosphoprotein [Allocatelliglobosispora scoriae]MBB5872906.1 hypothetical protein [Allocatelliglobosispora scoriae]